MSQRSRVYLGSVHGQTGSVAIPALKITDLSESRRRYGVILDTSTTVRNTAVGSGLSSSWNAVDAGVGAEVGSDTTVTPYIAARVEGAWVKTCVIRCVGRLYSSRDLRAALSASNWIREWRIPRAQACREYESVLPFHSLSLKEDTTYTYK